MRIDAVLNGTLEEAWLRYVAGNPEVKPSSLVKKLIEEGLREMGYLLVLKPWEWDDDLIKKIPNAEERLAHRLNTELSSGLLELS